jgi:thermitase
MRLTRILLLWLIMLPACVQATEIYVDSQVVCRVQPGADPDTVAATVEALVTDGIESAATYLFHYRTPTPVDSVVQRLIENPDVVEAHPNFIIRLNLYQVSQPFVDGDQTNQAFVDGISPAHFFEQYAESNLLMDSAHLINRGEGTVIAVIDGGCDSTNPVFEGRIDDASFDFVDIDYDPWVNSGLTADHGTFVAGIAARSAPDASLMIVRCFGVSGSGTSFDIAHGIYYAAEHGADVINMSFGMDRYNSTIAEAIETAYYQYGVVMTAAAGNSGMELDRFPASLPCVLSVAAVDSADIKTDFSNYGFTVSLTAPGENIYSSLAGGNIWGWWSGTSFSTAFVSGLAALLKSMHPDIDPNAAVETILRATDNINDVNPAYTLLLGDGRVNFLKTIYLPGDANGSGGVNLGDVVYLVNHIFKSGPEPIPPESGDANCDGMVNIGDAVFLVDYIFRSGPEAVRCDW